MGNLKRYTIYLEDEETSIFQFTFTATPETVWGIVKTIAREISDQPEVVSPATLKQEKK